MTSRADIGEPAGLLGMVWISRNEVQLDRAASSVRTAITGAMRWKTTSVTRSKVEDV